jgi:hypothetical protein
LSPPLPRTEAGTSQVSLSARTWTALIIGFSILVILLAVTAVTLISQRQRTVELNKQLGALLNQTTQVLGRVGPVLDAVPAQSSTIASRARDAADLVSQARPLVSALNASGFPGTVSAAGQLLQSIDQPGALSHTLANVDELTTSANQVGLVPRLALLLSDIPAASSLISEAQDTQLISRLVGGLDNIGRLVSLQRAVLNVQSRTLAVQEATLRTARQTRKLTTEAAATARRTLAVVETILAVAKETLAHTANIDRKTGPAPPASTGLP